MRDAKNISSEIYSEISYLWQAMGKAQENAWAANIRFQETLSESEKLQSRINHLEKIIREKEKGEFELKFKIRDLLSKMEDDEKTAAKAEGILSKFEAAQNHINALKEKLAKSMTNTKLSQAKIMELESRIKSINNVMTEKEELAKSLENKIKGLLNLPEIARNMGGNPRIKRIIMKLSEKAESEKNAAAEFLQQIKKLQADNVSLEKKTKDMSSRLSLNEAEMEKLKKELSEKKLFLKNQNETIISSQEVKEEFLLSLKDLKARYEKAQIENSSLESDKKNLEGKLKEADEKTFALEIENENKKIKIIKEKENFADAVKKIFHLQSKLNQIKGKLSAIQDENKKNETSLFEKKLDMEKIQMLLRETALNLKNEKEINIRFANKVKTLEEEVKRFMEKSAKDNAYAKILFEKLNDRQNTIDFLKKQLDKMDNLELELENEKRKNVKMNSLLLQEQTDFTDKIINSLGKLNLDLKIMNVKIPANARRMLSSYMKNLSGVINLLKGWQQYVDQTPPSSEYLNIREVLDPMLAQWDKTFRLKRLKIIKRMAVDSRCKLNKDKIRFAFYQIIKNSYEAMLAGGTLTVSLTISEDKDKALIKFEDTSKGLSREVIENLYNPFNTTKKEHVGIGLVVAKKIAEIHGGKFSIANRKIRGIVAEFRLPVSRDEGEPKFEKEKKKES